MKRLSMWRGESNLSEDGRESGGKGRTGVTEELCQIYGGS